MKKPEKDQPEQNASGDSPDTLDPQLSAYLDDELSKADRHAVQQRLAHDEKARQQLAQLRATINTVGELPTANIPPGFSESWMRRIASAENNADDTPPDQDPIAHQQDAAAAAAASSSSMPAGSAPTARRARCSRRARAAASR